MKNSLTTLALTTIALIGISGCKEAYQPQIQQAQSNDREMQEFRRLNPHLFYDDSWRNLPSEIQNHPNREEIMPYIKK